MISLKNLVSTTPFAEETKQKLLKDLETMTSHLKLELEMLCWRTLAEVTEFKYNKEQAKIMLEVSQEKRQLNLNDFTEAKVRLYHQLASNLEHAESDEQIDEVRKQLEKHKAISHSN